jgi:crotonobetainyl-CoA:carnitine CoA-transferase CaiB-like acyl-CoA transferase
MRPLDDLRLIDLTSGPVGGLASMVLADFGAEVIKVEAPAGDPTASHPAARMWLRGKIRSVCDLSDAAQAGQLRALILESAEAVLTDLPIATLEDNGLDASALQLARPDLVVGHLSGFAATGPHAWLPLDEGVVAARLGRMLGFEGVASRDGPVFSALQVATHATSQAAAATLIAGLVARETTGTGTVFETSLARGLLPYEMGGLLAAQQPEHEGPITSAGYIMPTLNYHPVQCADGRWLQLGNLLPHLFARFLSVAGLEAPSEEEPFLWPKEVREAFRDKLLTHMQGRTAAEWMAAFVADGGVVAHPYQTTQEALADPDIVANDHVVDTSVGRQLGLVARLTATPGQVGEAIASVGAALVGAVSRPRMRAPERSRSETAPTRAAPTSAPPAVRPLEGITVVEFATIIAAPLGTAMLADLGARVIKVEPLNGDPFRSMGAGIGAARVNTGKESICLDLKKTEGQVVAQQLVGRADILVHNYRPGVPERLGIGYAEVSRDNPSLVYLSVNGYGPDGPGAKRPSTHPIPGAALGGVLHQFGGAPMSALQDVMGLRDTARRLFRANEVNPDPNTSMVVATAATLGLAAAKRFGIGQQVFVDMFGANAYANFDDFVDFPDKPERAALDADLLGLGPGYRLYQCAEGWVFLGLVTESDWTVFNDAVAELSGELGGNSADLEALFLERDANWFEAALSSRGIACVRADRGVLAQTLMEDPIAEACGLVVEADSRAWGQYRRHGPVVAIRGVDNHAGAVSAGENTDTILMELGYGNDGIGTLRDNAIVGG